MPYSMRVEQSSEVRHKPKIEGALPLSNFDGQGGDLLKTFDAFIRGLLTHNQLVERGDDRFGQPTDVVRKGRTVSFAMKGGATGLERWVRLDANSKEETLKRDGLLSTNFHVWCVVPQNSTVAWLLVEKNGYDSLPSVWRREFVRAFKARHRGYKVTISQIRNDAFWRLLEQGLDDPRVLEIKVLQRAQPSKRESETRGFPLEVSKTEETLYRANKGRMTGRQLKRIRRFFTISKRSDGSIVEIDLADDSRDEFAEGLDIRLAQDVLEITVHAEIDGRRKTVRFSGAREPAESYVVEGLNGTRVSPEVFRRECRSHTVDLARVSGATLADKWDTGEWTAEDQVSALEVPFADSENDR
ncbi:RexA family abortive infection protein [Mycobacterium phage Sejanus]|nr:RexA family abortive infection protein [Mycobacterium phage Sejanus]